MGLPKAFCFAAFGRAKAPWRANMDEARADAFDAGYGHIDEYSHMVYITVPGEIWSTEEDVLTLPRSTIKRRQDLQTAAASQPPLNRIERIIARKEARYASER